MTRSGVDWIRDLAETKVLPQKSITHILQMAQIPGPFSRERLYIHCRHYSPSILERWRNVNNHVISAGGPYTITIFGNHLGTAFGTTEMEKGRRQYIKSL